jgi:DNA-binding transcriptional LysR family regulator
MADWDDLRIFIAAARAGSLTEAARGAGVDPATVGRRVARLESALKATLLVRSARGLTLTAAGGRVMEAALTAEAAVGRALGRGEEEGEGGSVRLSAAEGFGTVILAPALPDLLAHRPGLKVELVAGAGFLSPGRREADVAITLSASASTRVMVEPLTGYQLALYAAPAYLAARGPVETIADLPRHDLVAYVEDLIYAPELRYHEEIGAGLKPALTSSSILAQAAVIRAGGGVGVLPCFLADGLVPLLVPEVVLARRFWISTHVEVAETARVKSVRRWLRELVERQRPLLEPYVTP